MLCYRDTNDLSCVLWVCWCVSCVFEVQLAVLQVNFLSVDTARLNKHQGQTAVQEVLRQVRP